MTLAKPAKMVPDDWWLHLHAMLSRVRVAHRALVHDLPPWGILEKGPPAHVREGARRFEETAVGSFATAQVKAKELGWDVVPLQRAARRA
eukprot:4184097-Pyramimonas_sp.AAC.1